MNVSLGETVRLTVRDIAFGGEGVGTVGEFVVFVPFVVIGEEVEAVVTEVKKRFARAQLHRVLKPAAERVSSVCPYFGQCGGCQYQHLQYAAQLRVKFKQIADLFERVGGITGATIDPVVPCPQPYGYRNRIMVRSQWDKFKQGLNIGYIRYDNRLVVDVECCPIAESALNEELRALRAHPPPKGGLKVVLRTPVPGWEVPKDSFFQNNSTLLPELTRIARERIAESEVRFLVDVYCGVGFFSLELADLVTSYRGIELDERAIQAARRNASNRKRSNGDFLVGTAEELLPAVLEEFNPDETAVVLDPPRTGCTPLIIELLRATQVEQILYISCHPATLARDLNLLSEGGLYTISRVTPVDMFPQTQHVECIADVRLRR